MTGIMVRLVFLIAVAVIEYVYGRPRSLPPLPTLPTKDGCNLVDEEVNLLRVENEAVILSFPKFERVLEVYKIAPSTAKYIITKDNGTEGVTYQGEGRVQQRDNQLWLLPAVASDSGNYICTYRNETYCVTGSIKLQVCTSSSADMQKMIHHHEVPEGQDQKLRCPSLSYFNNTERLIEWHKISSPGRSELGSFSQARGRLIIPAVRRSDAGLYTCQLRVLINNQHYKVTRTIQLTVVGLDPETTATVPDLSMTSDPGLISSSSPVHTPVIRPPVIVSPLNGTVFESQHGSGLELTCKVMTECQTAQSTVVTWLVNDQSVESSYLDGRALQGGRRVTRVSEGCHIELRLVVVAMTDEDVETQLKCVTENQGGRQEVVAQLQLEDSTFTWLVVAVAASSGFLAVVSIFLYVLFKPQRKKKMDYILARQNSTF